EVLENVHHAQSIHFQIVHDGLTSEVWTDAEGRLRREDPDGTYQIAANGKLWRIDEKANQAIPGPSPYHRAEAHTLDLFTLLGLPVEPDSRALAACRPVSPAESGDETSLIYHLEVPTQEAPVEIVAAVDRQSRLLLRL